MALQQDRFEALVRDHKDAVYRQMVRVCGHREDAEDALASALMHAYQSLHQLQHDAAFRSWLSMIGKRVCTRMRAHPAIQQSLEYAERQDLFEADDADFDLAVLKNCVRSAIEDLPEIYRDVYTLCEIEERPLAEAAQMVGISLAAAKSRLHRAREIVREQLDKSICGESVPSHLGAES